MPEHTVSSASTTSATRSAASRRRRDKGHHLSRSVKIVNKSGVKFDAFWVHSVTGELAHSNTDGAGVAYGGDVHINSYVSHTFELQELPEEIKQYRGSSFGSGKCRKEVCMSTQITVKSTEEQVFTVWKDFVVTVEDHKTAALKKAKETLQGCSSLDKENASMEAAQRIEALVQCMDGRVKKVISETEEQIDYEANVRKNMGVYLTKYACLDENAEISASVSNYTWSYFDPINKKETVYNTQTPFDTYESTSLLVEDFISAQQCQVLEQFANKNNDNKNQVTVPLYAKKDSTILELLLKVQNLVQYITKEKVAFNDEPLLYMHSRHATTATTQRRGQKQSAETCGNNGKDDDGSYCKANLDNDNDNWWFESGSIPLHSVVTVAFFCPSSGGALHFPKTTVHIPAAKAMGSALLIHHKMPSEDTGEDAYMSEYAFCLPQKADTNMTLFTLHVD
eukprot:CAMPEP_0198141108 /NCGR_PEP_ID=MMETSP1443-20131203/4181_1 /TAXON_ID=186043 /ORGANISM="Entomoneis sp., Strain CCMP2396" /LENGTH=451 /DNA_ID=CAMNT_0043803753 /DNA_START=109 /DNA_END=1464 /DNA_ORIENTATION=+